MVNMKRKEGEQIQRTNRNFKGAATKPEDLGAVLDCEEGCEDADAIGYDRRSGRRLLEKTASERSLSINFKEAEVIGYDRRSRKHLLEKAASLRSISIEDTPKCKGGIGSMSKTAATVESTGATDRRSALRASRDAAKAEQPKDLLDLEQGCEDTDVIGYDRRSGRKLLEKAASERGLTIDFDEAETRGYDRRSRKHLLQKAASVRSLTVEDKPKCRSRRQGSARNLLDLAVTEESKYASGGVVVKDRRSLLRRSRDNRSSRRQLLKKSLSKRSMVCDPNSDSKMPSNSIAGSGKPRVSEQSVAKMQGLASRTSEEVTNLEEDMNSSASSLSSRQSTHSRKSLVDTMGDGSTEQPGMLLRSLIKSYSVDEAEKKPRYMERRSHDGLRRVRSERNIFQSESNNSSNNAAFDAAMARQDSRSKRENVKKLLGAMDERSTNRRRSRVDQGGLSKSLHSQTSKNSTWDI